MRKYIVYVITFFCFISIHANAYSSNDVTAANALASSGIIVDHSNDVASYRLDDSISRQEVVGIAIKMLGMTLPDNYICQGYFSDSYFPVGHSDIWVCRSVEMAADNNLVSRDNTLFRPKDTITRAEALSIIMKSKNIIYPKNVTTTLEGQVVSEVYPTGTPQWHIDLIEGAKYWNMLVFGENEDPYNTFMPNRLATRADVFVYANNALNSGRNFQGILQYKTDNTVTYIGPDKDFEITIPEEYLITGEETMEDDYTMHLSAGRADEDDILLTSIAIGSTSCSQCDTTELEGMEEGEAFGTGTIKQKLSDTLYIIDGQNELTQLQGYVRYVFNPKTKKAYFTIAFTAVDTWVKYKKELLTIVNSLKVYK